MDPASAGVGDTAPTRADGPSPTRAQELNQPDAAENQSHRQQRGESPNQHPEVHVLSPPCRPCAQKPCPGKPVGGLLPPRRPNRAVNHSVGEQSDPQADAWTVARRGDHIKTFRV